MVTNGGFDTDSDWIKGTGWSISGGTANCDGTQTSNSNLLQSNTATSGNTYKITYTITNYVSGTFKSVLGVGGVVRNSNGVYSEYITATSSSFLLQANSDFIGSIDNVSVKEYLGQSVVPESGCGSWLFEPASRNLVTYSEDFSDASWTKSGSVVLTPNIVISPDGTQNAFEVNFNDALPFLFSQANVIAEKDYTFSFYIKKGTSTNLKYRLRDITNSFDIISPTSYFSEILSDKWTRIQVTFTTPLNCNTLRFYPFSDNGSLGTAYIWGAMLEEQSYTTSYIPTNGEANGVSRNQDLCTNGGSLASINSTEGTLYFEGAALADDGTTRSISLNNGTSATRVAIVLGNSNNRIRGQVRIPAGTSFDFSTFAYNFLNFNKIAISYKLNEFKMYVNGTLVSTDTNGNTPIGLSELSFNLGGGASPFYGKTKALAVWKEALSDSELTELTTI